MAVAKKNIEKANTKNLTRQQPKGKQAQTLPQNAAKQDPVPVQTESKQESRIESPVVNENVAAASQKENTDITMIAVGLLAAIWYMACMVVIL